MHKSKNIVHINTKAKRSQTSCFQEVWPFYSLTSVKDGSIACLQKRCKEGKKILNGLDKTIQNASFSFGKIYIMVIIRNANKGVGSPESLHIIVLPV